VAQAVIVDGKSETSYFDFDSCRKSEDSDSLTLDLLDSNGEVVRALHLPSQGQSIYITNERGQTIQTYHWPPKMTMRVAGQGP
jgi:hypothetical protein